MEGFCILMLVSFLATNSLDKAESVQLEELPLKTFDEIFGEGWWDKDKADEWDKLTLEHNFHHEIDRQNTQIGPIEPNSTDQNPSLTESDHSENANSSKNLAEDERKRKIIDKFHAMKDELKQKGKFHRKDRNQIEVKIAKHLKVSRKKIYEWKKEFGLSQINPKNERKNLIEKFDQRKAELKRAGIKNSYLNQINESVAKELGLCFKTISNWKRELGKSKPKQIYPNSEQNELMKLYYEIKEQNPKFRDEYIAKMLKIGRATLCNWKKQFKQQHHQNSVDSVEVNAGSNVGTRTREVFE